MSNQTQNWRVQTDAVDYFGGQKKTLDLADRRPVIRKASDLVGPGIDNAAVRITDFNNILATFNGYYSADIGAASAPNETDMFIGHVEMDVAFGGKQTFTSLQSGEEYTRVFLRSPTDATSISWGGWRCSDHVPPTIYQIGDVNPTDVPDSTTTLLNTPDCQTFGTEGTFTASANAIIINRPGVYSGWMRMRASSSTVIGDPVTIYLPDGASMNPNLIFRTVPLYNSLWIPLHFWTTLSTGFIRAEVTQTTGVTRSITWSTITLSRIGDAPSS